MKQGIAAVALVWLVGAVASTAAFGQQKSHDAHAQHGADMTVPAGGKAMPAMNQAYVDSMQQMHTDMAKAALNPDADTAFAQGMLAHHEGAVLMARVQLKYGKDAQMRKLAENVIAAQEQEIAEMKQWLKSRGQQ